MALLCRASAPSTLLLPPPPTPITGFSNLSCFEKCSSVVMIGAIGRRRNKLIQTRRFALVDEQDQVSFTQEENSLIEALTSSDLIEGRWQLMFTTRPGTASPIQRTFVGVDFFSVIQEVYLRSNDPRVSNIVKFSDFIGELKVEAIASIKDGKRILFQFDRAAFSFKFLPFKFPYPVPFRLLGDEAKGWLDTTYLSPSGNLRISRGNKGTTFVLQKKTEIRQKLLSAISTDKGVLEAIDELISTYKEKGIGEIELQEGEWQMLWSSQYLVDILLGLKFSMVGTFVKSDTNTYDVTMDDAAIVAGGFGYPLELGSKFVLELLYSDDKIRITRGYNKIMEPTKNSDELERPSSGPGTRIS
ncbi:hypothetical protein G4B88_004727 [Cannabis sativa]|uniref:Plastid lipid-associated protein/fibrillin conserved domain-containing protein n=1 Tax=Cannabis sativa TaxID=3483 RepID=A0A7J6FW58_CANSA|nr:hypothetical protein G4B88_004727 [Cannabis sativa]